MNSQVSDGSVITCLPDGGAMIGSPPVGNGNTHAPTAISLADELASMNVLLPKRLEVETYLAEHPAMRTLLRPICQRVRIEFGPNAELSLIVYRDPEILDRYLTLYVRERKYDTAIIDRIESISAEFADSISALSGHLLINTDFRSIGG